MSICRSLRAKDGVETSCGVRFDGAYRYARHLHPLKGELAGHWSVRVSGNWRLTFKFEGEDAIVVNYFDYH
jgi:proteic killer suppression protein